MEGKCGFCGRIKELTFHHYIPVTLHSNKFFRKTYDVEFMKSHGIDLCDNCHDTIHQFFSEKELGKNYNDKNKLLSNEKFRNFLKWIKKQH